MIGVIDLLGGRAVHARGGIRDEYESIGDPVELARTYVDRYGVSELYVANLDAIRGGRHPDVRDLHTVALGAVCGAAPTWLDAGISSVERARDAIQLGAARVIVGLETLPSFETLEEICDCVGRERAAFSLDLRNGEPIGIGAGHDPSTLTRRAAIAGAGAIVVLDLARVGMRTGLDLDVLKQVRRAATRVELIAGGGVRGPDDLGQLAAAGCDGALVATALRDGSLATLKGPRYEGRSDRRYTAD